MMAARAKVLANTQFDALKNFQEEVIALNVQTTVTKRVSTLYAGALAESLHNNATAAQRHIEALRQIKELDNQSKYVLQLLDAEVKIKSAQFTQAVALIQPLSDSRAKQLMLAQARLGTQQKHIIKESVDDLVMWLVNHPRDAGAWSWLSQATKLQGDELRSVRSDAESRAFQYDEIGAIDRLKAAQDLSRKMSREGKLDRSGQIESAIIDSRLRELEVARKELLLQK
jgi:predicted Zn-dependent protease